MKRYLVLTVLVAGAGLAGCSKPKPSPWQETMTQVSTYEALQAGRYQGQVAVSNLLEYGDVGLGTYDRLDGEMVVVSGVVYQVAHTGVVSVAPPDALVPFACVTWFEPDLIFDVGSMNQKIFQQTLQWKNPAPERIQALRVRGAFKRISLRSVPAQNEPFQPLSEVVANQQQVWDREGVRGTMVGFITPHALAGASPEGFHLHFISEDATVGGHVLDFDLAGGRIELDTTPAFHLLLPPPHAPAP